MDCYVHSMSKHARSKIVCSKGTELVPKPCQAPQNGLWLVYTLADKTR